MNDSIESLLQRRWKQFAVDVRALLGSSTYNLGNACPPEESGIYVLFDEYTTLTYAGSAANLCDRFHKHVSGDESHAVQRALADRFPDRSERRTFIKENVQAKWLVISDPIKIADLERLLIWLYQPGYGIAVSL
jgi:excinuclease UvrABC nuclease subunit